MTDFRTTTVPVRGGDLAVGVWGPDDAPTVLAVHGITATHRAWELLAAAAPGLRIIAPDLRGRGRSNGLPGPWGMPTHADDLAAVLDAFGVERCVVVGHSMGAFASATLALRHPQRVAGLVMIDGGLPIALPAGVAQEDLPEALIGPAAERLSMTFASREEYRDFWRVHPAFANDWSAAVERYVDYDLDGVAPWLTPSSVYEAIAEDSLQLSGATDYADALAALTVPVHFVRAPRGLLDAQPLYPEQAIAAWANRMPSLLIHETTGVNHYTIIMAERGIDAVLPIVLGAVAAATEPA